MTVDIGQAELPTLVTKGKFLMVDPTEVQNSRLDVMHMDSSLGYVPPKLIGLPIHRTGLDSGSGHNPAEGTAKMIPTRWLFGVAGIVLPKWSAAKFTSPDHQSVLEHIPILKVLNEGCGRSIGIYALLFQLAKQVAMLVPSGMHQLDEAGTTLQ